MEATFNLSAAELMVVITNGTLWAMASTVDASDKKQTEAVNVAGAAPVSAPVQAPPAPVFEPVTAADPVPFTQPMQAPAAPPVIPVAPAAIPTAAPGYSFDQLAVAATQIMDMGRQQDLLQLLAGFGIQSLTALPKDAFGAFANQLRALGAKL